MSELVGGLLGVAVTVVIMWRLWSIDRSLKEISYFTQDARNKVVAGREEVALGK